MGGVGTMGEYLDEAEAHIATPVLLAHPQLLTGIQNPIR